MRLRTRRTFLSALMAVCLIAVSATAAMAAAPVITSLSATSGHVGQNVTINGSGFSGFAAGQVQVLFHGGVARHVHDLVRYAHHRDRSRWRDLRQDQRGHSLGHRNRPQ